MTPNERGVVPAMGGGGVASRAYVKKSEAEGRCTRRCCNESNVSGEINEKK